MAELTDFVKEGRKFLSNETGFSEEHLELVGRVVRLKDHHFVESIDLHPRMTHLNVNFHHDVYQHELDRILSGSGISHSYSSMINEAVISIRASERDFHFYFRPMRFD